jgi:hypothetical protein
MYVTYAGDVLLLAKRIIVLACFLETMVHRVGQTRVETS